MNNKEKYKAAMSGVRHSDEATEKIFEMTVDKRQTKKHTFKRLASAALALAILIGGGFGVNQIVYDRTNPNDTNPGIVESESNPLTVMVAYAGEYKQVSDITADSMNEQQIFYSIHYADIEDKEAVSKAKALFDKDKSTVLDNAQELSNEGYTARGGSGSQGCWSSEKDKETAILYTVRGGGFALNLDDYSNVKSLTFENNSAYGNLVFDCLKTWQALEENVEQNGTGMGIIDGHKFTITGEELMASQDSKMYEGGTKHKVNKGYNLNWEPSDELYNTIGNDLNFDLSQIKDTITFTVEFDDGTVKTASINLFFDSDGYMHFE